MAACGSLQHMFENPLPSSSETPSLLESICSWNQTNRPVEPPFEQSSLGETHLNENPDSFPASSNFRNARNYYDNLQMCTEGLGFESFDDVEEMKIIDINEESSKHQPDGKVCITGPANQSRGGGGAFPPPIYCIGKSGKPWVSFKSYRHDGRFVLKQVRMPTQEFLHAHREDGRLQLHFLQPPDEIAEEDEEEVEDDENYIEEEYEQEESGEAGR